MHAQFVLSAMGCRLFNRLNVQIPKFCGLPDIKERLPIWVALRSLGLVTPWICIGYYGQQRAAADKEMCLICVEKLPNVDYSTIVENLSAEDLERYNTLLNADDYSAMLFYIKTDAQEYCCVYDPRILLNDGVGSTPMAIMQKRGELDVVMYDMMND
jgi:hypothetical protein